jgi:dihydroneopterin aldolase
MTDRIALRSMAFDGRHGVSDAERSRPQPFEVDVELWLDLAPAGRTDDLARTVDYGAVFGVVRAIVETTSHRLLESLADAIAVAVLRDFAGADEVVIRVRKVRPPIDGRLAWAGVEIRRSRAPADAT